MKRIFLVLVALAISATSWAQSDARPEILVLGTYRMSNPGRDIYNMQADDVLSPKRQQEIAQLIEVLKKFHPTKIAIEADAGSQRVQQEYSDYVAGKYTLTRNETNQIAYRMAKELSHHAVYSVDQEGDFPWPRVVNYAKANARNAPNDRILVIYGAGHLAWLRQDAGNDATVKLRTLAEFTAGQ
jgi:hypothetical protein